jgi:hypothetical protein
VDKILKDREVLLAHFDFPADHWIHLRTTNAIESTFATVRLRTRKTKGLAVAPPACNGLQTAGGSRGALALRQRTPPGRTRSRWGDFRGRIHHRARKPTGRRMIRSGQSTTLANISS